MIAPKLFSDSSKIELGDTGTSISFLKKKVIQLDDGILITPGVPIEKIVETYESAFGGCESADGSL